MADGKLVFLRPADGSGKLVFGDTGGAVVVPPAELSVDCGIAGEGAAALVLRTGPALHIDAGVAGEGACSIVLEWDANVSRVTRAGLRSQWQEAAPVATGLRSAWQESGSISVGHIARWQPARPLHTAVRTHWQATTPYRGALLSRWEQGTVARRALQSGWQETTPRRAAVIARWQQAAPARHVMRPRWEEATRLRNVLRSHWQDATPIRGRFQTSFTTGAPIHVRLRSHWQEARKPPPGRWAPPPGPPIRPPCYDPARLGLLVFDTAFSGSGKLVFVCHRAGGGETPGGETIIVPVRRVYIVINNTYLTRVSDGAPIPVHSMGLSLDAGSWTWGFAATLPAVAQALVEPTANGPVELAAFVNGTEFRVLAEEISSERVFLSKQIRVSGRGANARLDSPFAPQQIFANTAMRTTEQLMGDVLTINGVPFGYTVDYRLTPWVVPAGGFVHLGTYISALTAIANAGGGYLRPHPSLQKFDVLHRYPTAPWEPVTPDIILPAAVTTRESITWVEKPDYNRVFVSGQDAGVLGDVRRQGTAFDKAAPMVVDALITDAAAAQQKGLEVLGNTGRQYEVGLRLPVLAQTGVIQPGVYVQYVDGAITRTGIVRSTQVEVGEIDVYQTIGVEVRG